MAKEAGVTTRTIQHAKTAQTAGLGDAVIAGALTAEQASDIAKGKPVKAKPAPAPTVEVSSEDEYTALDAANDQISELQAALVVANMGDVAEEDKTQAATHIVAMQAEIKTLTASLRAVTISRDTLLHENAQMKRQMAAQRREIDRLK